mgnify:CR=1 FL=1
MEIIGHTNAYLFEETQPSPIGNGLVEWTRRFGTVPSSFSYFDGRNYSFFGYYASYEDNASFRAPCPKAVIVQIFNSFLKTSDPETNFPFTTSEARLLSINGRGDYVSYVDGSTNPTISSYQSMVSSSSLINIADPTLERCYGAGNIWRKRTFETPAQ